MLRRLLLLPLLSPLLALLMVGALNPRPGVSLRLLIWSSPALPLGAWIALAGAGGAALSAGATALALAEGAAPLGRQVRRRMGAQSREPWEEEEPLEAREPLRRQRWQESEAPEPAPAPPARGDAGRSRAPGEPAPTVAVPFRVIRRGGGSAPAEAEPFRAPRRAPIAEPVPAGDDWGAAASDDW
ncbi:MAG: hypothetical protein ACKOZW_10115 [Cyanobium sp.]